MSKINNIDLKIYSGLVLVLIIYSIYLRSKCEGIGCLTIVIPIIATMILSAIEFMVNLIFYFKGYSFTAMRKILFGISTIITIILLLIIFLGTNK